jgi:hypothetical protein
MKVRKRQLAKHQEFCNKDAQGMIMRRMSVEKSDGYIRSGTFSSEVVWGNTSFIFPIAAKKKHSEFKKGMFLFGMVRKDAKNFLAKGIKFKLPKRNPSVEYNMKYVNGYDGAITATDLNHAYWRIAYNLGIITKHAYIKGLEVDSKATRLAALSTLGSSKKYFIIKNGDVTNEMITVGGDEQLAKLYTYIRYTCFKMMKDVKKMLGDDFLGYKVDCIYYVKSKENIALVRNYFKEKGLVMKQLV